MIGVFSFKNSIYKKLRDFRLDQSGATSIITGLSLVMMCGFAALAVDMGAMFYTRTHLQATADASALAAVATLRDNDGTLDQVQVDLIAEEAIHYAQRNMPTSLYGNVLAVADVVPGYWDVNGKYGTPRTFYDENNMPGGESIDAVQVITRRSSDNGNPVKLMFARVFGA